MKPLLMIKSITATTLLILAVSVQAHSPEMHKKDKAEKPDCEALNNMDHSKMDMNDPVMQAMMKQCMDDHHGGNHQMDDHHGGNHQENKHYGNEHQDDHQKKEAPRNDNHGGQHQSGHHG